MPSYSNLKWFRYDRIRTEALTAKRWSYFEQELQDIPDEMNK